MLFRHTLPLLLYALTPPCFAAQIPIQKLPTTQSTTLVDLLSADPDYTTLLHLLQRARLIPTLNKLNGSTFFAPTNDAIGHLVPTDNINEKLRQELLYHMLNYTLPSSDPSSGVQVQKTLHFPNAPIPPPSHEPPPNPPWLPVPGGTLGGEPQRLRTVQRDGAQWVGVDANGQGGVKVVKERVEGSNGALIGIGSVLEVPPDLGHVIAHHPSLSYLQSILPTSLTGALANSTELTLFLPIDNAWQSLHPIERLYLESEFAANDLRWILGMHSSGGGVGWSETFGEGRNFTTVEGTTLEVITSGDGTTTVAGAPIIEKDIYASNGVLHTVSSLLLPPGSLKLTPEKYLLALNCSSFVSLLHSVGLEPLINSTDSPYTILAPRDDVLSVFGDEGLPEKGTEELKRTLQYHFLKGRWNSHKLKDGMLVETVLTEEGLGGQNQVLPIGVNESSGGKGKHKGKNLVFGGARIIGDPIEIGDTIIYLLSRPLTPPVDVLQTALPSLHLSTFIASVFSTALSEKLKTAPHTSVIAPHNSAFGDLGLVTSHLLSSSGKADLEQVVLHHTIDSVEYMAALRNGSDKSFKTLEGSDVSLERESDGKLWLGASGGWAGMVGSIDTTKGDVLTQTGVLHEIDGVLIPRSVKITVGKLLKAAKGGTMGSLVVRAGMEWVLNGTGPPEGSEWDGSGASWTLLVPTDDAFKAFNLSAIWDDVDQLKRIVGQHLIPSLPSSSPSKGTELVERRADNKPIYMDDLATYSTYLSHSSVYGDIVFRASEERPGHYVVGIKGARGTNGQDDWARILSWGRSSTIGNAGGGVVQIDRVLMPFQPRWWVRYGPPAAVGVGGTVALGLLFWGIAWYWKRGAEEATYEPIGNQGEDDE